MYLINLVKLNNKKTKNPLKMSKGSENTTKIEHGQTCVWEMLRSVGNC